MLEGLAGLIVAAEVARTEPEITKTYEAYSTYVKENTPPPSAVKYEITYDISFRGTLKADRTEFEKVVDQTLTDNRGWARAGVKFQKVASGGRLHVVLASGVEVEKASPNGCSSELSCTVKPYVLINDDRWLNGTDSYQGVGIAAYRQMVINHEVGHFLGHDHVWSCDNGVAPVMLQQSTGLRGCSANSWPLASELWVRGI